MDLKEIRRVAKEKMKGFCRVCPSCEGRVCAGEVPGMGGTGTGQAFQENLAALEQYKLNLRTIHDATTPDTSLTLLDQALKTPIMSAPITGSSYNMGGALSEEDFVKAVITGSKLAGGIGWSGDGADPAMYNAGLTAIKKEQGFGIPVIKPRAQAEILQRIKEAEAAGAVGIGVDIDGAGLVTMALKGQPVGPKTMAELKEIISSTKLPFILKGIMTVDEAQIAVEVGAAAIVVSNHGGRILDQTPGAADVLPEIAEAVKGHVTIMADGGVRSGVDVLKLLALGADAVLVGRPVIIGAYGGGAEGVKAILDKYTAELQQAMILTGCKTIADINQDVLY